MEGSDSTMTLGKQFQDNRDSRISPIPKRVTKYNESPRLCETPVRLKRLSRINEDEVYTQDLEPPSPVVPHTNLTNHSTPPRKSRNFIATNPFEETIRKHLHLSFISPTLFTNVASPSQETDEFSWSVEDLASLYPADIDELQPQIDDCNDEQNVQERISRFFEDNCIVETPGDANTLRRYNLLTSSPILEEKHAISQMQMSYCDDYIDNSDNDEEDSISTNSKREAWTQTCLTFPLESTKELDATIEDMSSFHMENQHEKGHLENVAVSTVKKMWKNSYLQHCVDECRILDISSIMSGSSTSENIYSSPSSKNLLMSSFNTPKNQIQSRNFGTPLGNSLLSPIGLSPIVHQYHKSAYKECKMNSPSICQNWTECSKDDFCVDSGFSNTLSQTNISFPRTLPKDVEDALKPYHTFTKTQSEEASLNSSFSRRRKLLFHEDTNMSTASISTSDNGYNSL